MCFKRYMKKLVRKGGLEPPCLSATAPKAAVSAISPLPRVHEGVSCSGKRCAERGFMQVQTDGKFTPAVRIVLLSFPGMDQRERGSWWRQSIAFGMVPTGWQWRCGAA
jgi:hypothetical protein